MIKRVGKALVMLTGVVVVIGAITALGPPGGFGEVFAGSRKRWRGL